MQLIVNCIISRQEVQTVSLLFPILTKSPQQNHALRWSSLPVLVICCPHSISSFQGQERAALPIFPPKLRNALCSWLVLDCLSQFDSPSPILAIESCCCYASYICVCFPGAAAFIASFCWLHKSALLAARSRFGPHTNAREELCAAAVPVGSPATPWSHSHAWQCAALCQAQHPPRTAGNPTPGGFIHQHLHRSLKQPAIVRARDKDDSAFCRHLKCEIRMIFSHMWSNEQEHLWRER